MRLGQSLQSMHAFMSSCTHALMTPHQYVLQTYGISHSTESERLVFLHLLKCPIPRPARLRPRFRLLTQRSRIVSFDDRILPPHSVYVGAFLHMHEKASDLQEIRHNAIFAQKNQMPCGASPADIANQWFCFEYIRSYKCTTFRQNTSC